jgi:hypothetical protein
MQIELKDNQLIMDERTEARIARLPVRVQPIVFALLYAVALLTGMLAMLFGLFAMVVGLFMIPISLGLAVMMIPIMLVSYMIQEGINLLIAPFTARRLTYVQIDGNQS